MFSIFNQISDLSLNRRKVYNSLLVPISSLQGPNYVKHASQGPNIQVYFIVAFSLVVGVLTISIICFFDYFIVYY